MTSFFINRQEKSLKLQTLSNGICLNEYEDKDIGDNFLITGQVIKGAGRMPWH